MYIHIKPVLAHLVSLALSALFYLYKCVIKFNTIFWIMGIFNNQINFVSMNYLLKLNFKNLKTKI